MGFYINPSSGEKEDWLRQYGEPIPGNPDEALPRRGFYKVCLVNNFAFSAAGIAYNEDEYEAFRYGQRDGRDGRPFRWYWVQREHLIAVCPSVLKALA